MYKNKADIREKIMLAIYLLIFAVTAFTVARLQQHELNAPIYSCPPDETARYLVPKWIYEHGTIPTGLEAETQNPDYGSFSYAFLPGLSYMVMGYVMRFAGMLNLIHNPGTPLLIARSVNVFFGILTAFFIWLLGRRVFNKERYVWLFACGVTFLPQHLFIHTYVNTESMCMLSIAIILHALMRMRQDGVKTVNCAEFAVGASILTLSYYSAYGVLLFSIPIFVSFFVKKGADSKTTVDYKKVFGYGSFIMLIWAVLCLWWFIKQGIVLDGDFLGTAHRNETLYMIRECSFKAQGVSFWDMIVKNRPVFAARISFIGNYGSCSILGYPWMYGLYELFYICGVILVAIRACVAYKTDRKSFGYGFFFQAMLLCTDLATLILWLVYIYSFDYQPQGRYMFPALFHFYWLITKGYEWAVDKIKMSEGGKSVATSVVTAGIISLLLIYVFKNAVPVYLMG